MSSASPWWSSCIPPFSSKLSMTFHSCFFYQILPRLPPLWGRVCMCTWDGAWHLHPLLAVRIANPISMTAQWVISIQIFLGTWGAEALHSAYEAHPKPFSGSGWGRKKASNENQSGWKEYAAQIWVKITASSRNAFRKQKILFFVLAFHCFHHT